MPHFGMLISHDAHRWVSAMLGTMNYRTWQVVLQIMILLPFPVQFCIRRNRICQLLDFFVVFFCFFCFFFAFLKSSSRISIIFAHAICLLWFVWNGLRWNTTINRIITTWFIDYLWLIYWANDQPLSICLIHYWRTYDTFWMVFFYLKIFFKINFAKTICFEKNPYDEENSLRCGGCLKRY